MNSTKEPVITVENLVAKYGDKEILHGISTKMYPGEIKVILGTSGCGKTTLLKHVIGLLTPAAGRVTILGTEMGELDSDATSAVLRQIGVMYQYGALLGSLTIAENVALPLRMHTELPNEIIEEIVRIKLAQVSLSHAYSLYPGELSGGMVKRAAIARALVLDPPILFCDEPSAGLDPVTASGLDDLLLQMRDEFGLTVVVITHEIPSILKIADSIIYLQYGNVLYDGALQKAVAMKEGAIADFFNRRVSSEESDDDTEKSLLTIKSKR